MGVALLVLGFAALFGGADQYLGSLSAHPWAPEASLLSAPWLVLAFLAGCTRPTAWRAALLGLGCTLVALAGYWAMTLSPLEGARVTARGIEGLLLGQASFAIGGLVTGPLFGWLGYRWRSGRSLLAGAVMATAVCLEPLAHSVAGDLGLFRRVWSEEVTVGLVLMAAAVAPRLRRARR